MLLGVLVVPGLVLRVGQLGQPRHRDGDRVDPPVRCRHRHSVTFWAGDSKRTFPGLSSVSLLGLSKALVVLLTGLVAFTRGGALFYHLRVFLSSLLAFCKTQLSVSEGVSQIWIEIQVNNTLPLLLS